MHPKHDEPERRRGARVECSFWVQLMGLEEAPTLRRGDVSVSGLMADFARPPGAPGSVHRIVLFSADRSRHLEVIGRMVRAIPVPSRGAVDGKAGPTTTASPDAIRGVAFEFLYHDDNARAEMQEFVKAALAGEPGAGEGAPVRYTAQAQVARGPAAAQQTVRLFRLTGRRAFFESDSPFSPGEIVTFQVAAPESNRQLSWKGQVLASHVLERPDGPFRYSVEIGIGEELGELGKPTRSPPSEVRTLIEEAVVHGASEHRRSVATGLSGRLGIILLPNLLSFLELEQVNGVLTIRADGATGRIFMRDGQIVDVEAVETSGSSQARPQARPKEGAARRDALRIILKWTEGDFEFVSEPVTRKDIFQLGTSALVMAVMREP